MTHTRCAMRHLNAEGAIYSESPHKYICAVHSQLEFYFSEISSLERREVGKISHNIIDHEAPHDILSWIATDLPIPRVRSASLVWALPSPR